MLHQCAETTEIYARNTRIEHNKLFSSYSHTAESTQHDRVLSTHKSIRITLLLSSLQLCVPVDPAIAQELPSGSSTAAPYCQMYSEHVHALCHFAQP